MSLWAIAVTCAIGCTDGSGALPPVPPPAPSLPPARSSADVDLDRWWGETTARFFAAVRPVVGDEPVECNSDLRQRRTARANVDSPAVLASWFECAMSSTASGKPFMVLIEHAGGDVWSVSGVLGRPDGSVRAFGYMGDPNTRSELRLGPCLSPAARTDGTGIHGLRCANEESDGVVEMAEGPFQLTPAHADLSRRLSALSGALFVDCGVAFEVRPIAPWIPAARLEAALRCGKAARASGWPFRVTVHRSSVDSLRATGLVGTPSGEVRYFAFDSLGYGGADGSPSFTVRRCAHPVVARGYAGPDFDCVSPPTRRGPPSRRRPGS